MRLFQWLKNSIYGSSDVQSPQQMISFGDREFVKDLPYVLPKDDQEINRLDLQHYVLRYMLKANYVAPLNKPTRILDVGCGTGQWIKEIAVDFPDAEIVGVDVIKPSFPEVERPRNILLLQRDVLKGLPFTDGVFDYVHMRFLIGALPLADFQKAIRELIRVTRPGGWVELSEPGFVEHAEEGLATVWKWLILFGKGRNIDLTAGSKISTFLQKEGMINIAAKEVNFPVGAYAGRIGRMSAQNVIGICEGVRSPIVAGNLVPAEEYDLALAKAKEEVASEYGHASGYVYVAAGQKPA